LQKDNNRYEYHGEDGCDTEHKYSRTKTDRLQNSTTEITNAIRLQNTTIKVEQL
jgi:hypothetical protein